MSNDVFAVSASANTDLTQDDSQSKSQSDGRVELIESDQSTEPRRVPVEVVVNEAQESDSDLQDDAIEPVVEAVEPAMDVVEPVVEAVEPAVDVVEPVADAVEPAVDAVEPVADVVEPAVDAVELSVDVVEPVADVVEPAVGAVETEAIQAEATAEKPVTEAESKTVNDVSNVGTEEPDTPAKDFNAFQELGLSPEVMKAIQISGYETPSPIQLETVPHILDGRDLMGQAETGSGKTAAFAWPILSRIDPKLLQPQVLVLAPTRELAIQVTAAFEKYASGIKGFRAVTIYGGQSYETQLRALSRGVHVVVGTPGRVMDHLRRETLNLNSLKTFVLDEADEMLRMGFIDDVEWILEQIPDQRQILTFSATLPEPIQRIAKKYLHAPAHVTIKSRTGTADSINQSCLFLHPREKMEALVRLLETEETEGVLVFVKTRNSTILVAENLIQKGIIASPLNGDIPQNQRERTVNQLKSGRINVVVATDVAARGLDVKRISHVINYDFPHDTEAYVHRIGRTGRAGATGNAILFVEPKEKGKLSRLQRATNQRIDQFKQKSLDEINKVRVEKFKQRIVDVMDDKQIRFFSKLISDFQNESGLPFNEIAGALAVLAQGDSPLLLKELAKAKSNWRSEKGQASNGRRGHGPMTTYRLEVGRNHKVGPGNIVGAITNEANLNNGDIGKINIFDRFSTIDLPADLPQDIVEMLKNVQISGHRLALSKSERSYAKPGGRKSGHGGGRPKYEKRSKFGDKKFGDKKYGDKKFGDKTYGDKTYGDKPSGDKSHSFKKPDEKKYVPKSRQAESFSDKSPSVKKHGGKKPSRSNASGSVFGEDKEDRYSTYKGKKSFASKPPKAKTKAAERTKAKRKPGAKPSSPMKKYVKIRSAK